MSLALVLGFTWLVAPRPIQPAPDPVELRWAAPDGCPPVTVLREQIEHHLGRPLDEVPPGRVFAGARVQRRADARYWAEIELRTPSGVGRREVDADTCAQLTEGVAIVVSLAIDTWLESQTAPEVAPDPDPEPAPEPVPRPRPPPSSVPPPAEPAETAVSAPARAPRPPARVDSTIALRPGLGVGTLPFGASTALALGLAGPHWRLAMVGAHHFTRRARFEQAPGVGVDMRLYTIGVESGYAFTWSLGDLGLELPVRAGIEMGPLVGRGVGVQTPTTARPLWLAGGLGAGLAVVPTRWIAIGLQADAVLPLLRPAFDVEPLGVVHRVGSAGFRACAAVELRFSLAAARPSPVRLGASPAEPAKK